MSSTESASIQVPVNVQVLSSRVPQVPVPRMACDQGPQQPQPMSTGATATATVDPPGNNHGSVEGDLECLVCRECYTCARWPKLLGCQHAFCTVCLKLLLCVQDDIWSITCPLCRMVTAVPGGLICSLQDQEVVVGRLAQPRPEVQLCPQGLVDPATSATVYPNLAGGNGQDTVSANRVAARRLAAHLFLLVLLIVLILPFIYPGVIRWLLSFILALALLMSILFCCHPSSQGSRQSWSRTLFCREQKPSQISSIA